MGSAARFVGQFFPLFLLGALFGKLMEDSGSVASIARFMTEKLGPSRAMLAVVLAGALVTYGGVSLFVAFFVIAPMGLALFRAASIPRRLMPAAIALGTSTFTMSALPGTPADTKRHPDAVLRHDPVCGTGPVASSPPSSCWASACGGCSAPRPPPVAPEKGSAGMGDFESRLRRTTRSCASARPRAQAFDPAEIGHGEHGRQEPADPVRGAAAHRGGGRQPPDVVRGSAAPRRVVSRGGSLGLDLALGGRRRLVGGGCAARRDPHGDRDSIYRRLPTLRDTMDAGANASVLPIFSVASLVGFGAVVAAVPAFEIVRDWVLAIEGGPLVSLAIATNVLAALTGSASGGLTIALDALGPTYMKLAAETGLDPAPDAPRRGDRLRHARQPAAQWRRGDVARGMRHDAQGKLSRPRHGGIVGPIIALVAVIILGTMFGSF